jgi:UDP-galactopyranose mutase
MYDYLIVGAGLFGSVFARELAEKNKKILLIEKNNHVAGMCYSEKIDGIEVHKFGAHIFHTNNEKIWNYVNRFAEFNNYQHRVKVNHKNTIYSFPINLMTLQQVWGITTPQEAIEQLNQKKENIKNPNNLEDWCISQIGKELYEIFIKEYTAKQWGRDPSCLPSSIVKRLPIRTNYDDRYFSDKYQGIPINGYTNLVENILDHKNIKIDTNCNFFENKEIVKSSKKIVFTGKIDEFFDYKYGQLDYRSLKFEIESLTGDYQGTTVVNHSSSSTPYTRIIEHKHFAFQNCEKTVITKEYPDNYDLNKVPFYPVCDESNNATYNKYKKESDNQNIILGGRLATYQYLDMHQIIGQALETSKKEL